MRECDRIAIEDFEIPSLSLMECAARAVIERAAGMLGGRVEGHRIAIVCGRGNNGGDGFAVGRILRGKGADVIAFLIGDLESLSPDSACQAGIFQRGGGDLREVKGRLDLTDQFDLVIDALLGTGASAELRDDYRLAVDAINLSRAPILAVDIPTGVDGASGAVGQAAVRSTETVTFGFLKPGLLLSPGREHAGSVTISDIGIPASAAVSAGSKTGLADATDALAVLPQRSRNAHKGSVGVLLILAGSRDYPGASALAVGGALRSGAGLVRVGIPHSVGHFVTQRWNEAITVNLPETSSGALAPEGIDRILELIDESDAVAIGPGLSRDPGTGRLLYDLIKRCSKPLVLDADALNLLAIEWSHLKDLPASTVITPHPGEMARLTGESLEKTLRKTLETASEFARKWNVVVHLKGAPSITASPDGHLVINGTGNPGMATGGSGDVLTGVIGALLAEGLDPFVSAWAGAAIHGRAGDLAVRRRSERALIASDLIDSLGEVFLEGAG